MVAHTLPSTTYVRNKAFSAILWERSPLIGVYVASYVMNQASPMALGVAAGILWAGYVLLIGIMAMFGWGNALVTAFGSLYLGYQASVVGAIIGAAWGFVDGFIAGYVIAWIYNKML